MVTQIHSAKESAGMTTLVRKTTKSDSNFKQVLDNAKVASANNKVDLDAIFEKASATYNVPVNLLKAVAKAESDFQPNEVSSAGAIGIMQLMPATAKELGVTDAYDPEQNIMGGAKYLAQKLKLYNGDVSLTLAAYNAGSGNVKKYGGIPPFKETQNYVKKVMNYMNDYIDAPQVASKTVTQSSKNTVADSSLSNNIVDTTANAINLASANNAVDVEGAYERMKMSEAYWRLMEQLFSSQEEEESFI
ncbi:lytic transglycosylase domain-containing protein [Velocimicrobium porci]|uniref:Lytic transglycosylase domain-containing protein n=1 Tax=Velocimicrobium porci TaxID=2606634 RepID=A0A6L5XX76_9FIRM|nr:lytic transglycosylase domain-containing protein [Velocimicrobium porci]MSS63061.1 lytic transglycosylase domain-containing protein [Velocimicrobium porci]